MAGRKTQRSREPIKKILRTMFGSGRAGHARCVCPSGRVKTAMYRPRGGGW
nr:MAG TPA: hypothetical protein [Caudoviricetes sp.]